jgi:CDP-diacylglycerol--glycerol-3-phosphate 3-phosphatidyltransferase
MDRETEQPAGEEGVSAPKPAPGAAPFGRGRMRRLFGLDRSAPKPPQTRQGAPLRPLTIPNLVVYVRMAAIPVFLYLAFDSGDGMDATAAAIYWLVSVGDYLDGLLARMTGQYSRMGALLDPIVDRVTILSGAAVCWHFGLLPRWALVILGVRELATLGLAQYGLRHGVDLEVNWLGRLAVWPIMAAIFFAMVVVGWAPEALLFFGLTVAVGATLLYARMGRRLARERGANL